MANDAKVSEQLELIVSKRIAEDKLSLPALPAVAIKALDILRKTDFSLNDVGKLIEKDPVLAAQIIKSANSAAMAAREPAKTIAASVSRLGAARLRSLLVELSARRVFESKDPKIVESARKLWQHSRAVASVARDVSVLSGVADPDAAYLSGLLHDVGKPILATILLEAEDMILQKGGKGWLEGDSWLRVVQGLHRKVGTAIAKKWNLPDDVCASIEQCADYDPSDRLSVRNAVKFGNAVAKQEGLYVGEVDAQENEALVMVGMSLLGLNQEALTRLTGDLATRVRESA